MASTPKGGGARKTVLVVDDDRDVLGLLRMILEEEGYSVETAANGREALDVVARSMPHLILLDMRMPVMNGWDFAGEFNTRHAGGAPIVVTTAAADADAHAAEVGARGSIAKPFDLEELLEVVRRHL